MIRFVSQELSPLKENIQLNPLCKTLANENNGETHKMLNVFACFKQCIIPLFYQGAKPSQPIFNDTSVSDRNHRKWFANV